MMKIEVRKIALMAAALLIASLPALAENKTLSGEVSDAMCGAKHAMPGDAAACTRACVGKGSAYALVVGDKVYTLQSDDKAVMDKLDKAAGQQAKVTGEVKGDTVQVASVSQ
jgi:hypothetical protein